MCRWSRVCLTDWHLRRFESWLEKIFVELCRNKEKLLLHMLGRFMDDLFLLLRGTVEELQEFIDPLNPLNSLHSTFNFKCELGVHYNPVTRIIDFLDNTIWIYSNGIIQFTLYSKPFRVVQYLLTSSSHLHHITRNIPYILAYRVVRIESVKKKLEVNLGMLKEELVASGYG